MSESSKKLSVIIAAKDQTKQATTSAKGNVSGLGDAAAGASAKFLLVTEAIKQMTGMVDNFMAPAANFERSIQQSAVGMRLGAEGAEDLKRAVEDLSDSHLEGVFAMEETAGALRVIAAEGRGVAGSMEIMGASMNLAYSAGQDLVDTTNQLENIMSAWSLTVEDSAKISDVLLNTWMETGAEITVITPQLAQMGQLMQGLGMTMEEGAALIGVFADVGVTGVTGLLSAFTQLANSESLVSKELAKLGVSALDMVGNLKTPVVLFNDLADAGISATKALGWFGIRGSGSMIAAVNNISTVAEVMESNLNSMGTAAESAGQVAESAAGDYDAFKSSVEDLKLQLAEGLLPALTKFFEILQPIFKLLGDHPEIIYAIIGGYLAWKVSTIAMTVANAAHTASWWALTTAMLANPIFWIVAIIMAVILAWGKLKGALDWVLGGFKKLGSWLKGGFKAAWEGMKKGVVEFGSKAAGWFRKGLEAQKKAITAAGEKIVGWVKEKLGAASAFVKSIWNWGKHAGEKFAEGLKAAKEKLKSALNKFGGWIKDKLGFSTPPSSGPLHDVPMWGEHLVESYASGIISGLPAIDQALLALGARVEDGLIKIGLMSIEDRMGKDIANIGVATTSYITETGDAQAALDELESLYKEQKGVVDWYERMLWQLEETYAEKRTAGQQASIDTWRDQWMEANSTMEKILDVRDELLQEAVDISEQFAVDVTAAMKEAEEAAKWDVGALTGYITTLDEALYHLSDSLSGVADEWSEIWGKTEEETEAFAEYFDKRLNDMLYLSKENVFNSAQEMVDYMISGLESQGFALSTAVYDLIKDNVAAYLEFHSPTEKGPFHTIERWPEGWADLYGKGFQRDADRSFGGPVAASAGGLAPQSGGAGLTISGNTFHFNGPGFEKDGAMEKSARHFMEKCGQLWGAV